MAEILIHKENKMKVTVLDNKGNITIKEINDREYKPCNPDLYRKFYDMLAKGLHIDGTPIQRLPTPIVYNNSYDK